MSSTNAFLKDFIEMRKSLQQNKTPSLSAGSFNQGNLVFPDVSDPTKKKATKKEAPSAGKPKSNISDVQQLNEAKENEEVDMLQKIVNEKLPKQDVIAFLQNLANELTIKKMD